MARELAMTVFVDGERYDRGTVPPPEVAKKITSPYAWESTEDTAVAEDAMSAAAAADSEDADAKSRKAPRRA